MLFLILPIFLLYYHRFARRTNFIYRKCVFRARIQWLRNYEECRMGGGGGVVSVWFRGDMGVSVENSNRNYAKL